jgi:hypothetical protein
MLSFILLSRGGAEPLIYCSRHLRFAVRLIVANWLLKQSHATQFLTYFSAGISFLKMQVFEMGIKNRRNQCDDYILANAKLI